LARTWRHILAFRQSSSKIFPKILSKIFPKIFSKIFPDILARQKVCGRTVLMEMALGHRQEGRHCFFHRVRAALRASNSLHCYHRTPAYERSNHPYQVNNLTLYHDIIIRLLPGALRQRPDSERSPIEGTSRSHWHHGGFLAWHEFCRSPFL